MLLHLLHTHNNLCLPRRSLNSHISHMILGSEIDNCGISSHAKFQFVHKLGLNRSIDLFLRHTHSKIYKLKENQNRSLLVRNSLMGKSMGFDYILHSQKKNFPK